MTTTKQILSASVARRKLLFFGCTIAYLILEAAPAGENQTVAETSAQPTAKIFLIDDQSGEELVSDHGISPIQVADLNILVGGVVASQRPVSLFHELIDEDASDNEVRHLEMKPFAGGAPPRQPSTSLPLSQLVEESDRYRQRRAKWIGGIRSYRDNLEADAEDYVREITAAQLNLEGRFAEMLAVRNGRDFNRSDVAGSVLSAARHLGSEGLRIAVLNTDAIDLPGSNTGKASRTAALNKDEFDAGIVLVFVNTSGSPQQAAMFAGISNPIHHTESMSEAMKLVCALLAGELIDTNEGEVGLAESIEKSSPKP